jgi:predicted amidohydrolase YtcJ
MIDTFTCNNAYFLRDEKITGSLEVGKYADIVILEQDLFDVPVKDLHDVKVFMTIADGEVTYKG